MSNAFPLSNLLFRVGFLALLLPFSLHLHAQSFSCGFDEAMDQLRQSSPAARQAEDQCNDDLLSYLNQANQPDQGIVYYIPTVVHIIHDTMDITPGDPSNPTDAAIHALIDDLNQGFENVGIWDSTLGVNVEIQFCLAQQDTNGHYTTGITRDPGITGLVGNNFNSYYQNRYWNTNKYLNIYTYDYAIIPGLNFAAAGFSSLPSSHGLPNDGFAVTYQITQYPSSSTWIHEAGHYLGLYHTFQGGCTNQDCQTDGDRVCDTPPDGSQSSPSSCSDSVNTCTSDTADTSLNNPFRSIALGGLGDQNDPISNYMDYTSGICRKEFTQGQKDRMRGFLTTTRSSLLSSPGCQQVCSLPPSSFFTLARDTFEVGDTVYFNQAANNATWYEWRVDGQPYSNANDTLRRYLVEGRHVVSLCVANDSLLCDTLCFSRDFYIECPIQTDFMLSDTMIDVGETVTFSAQTQGATTFAWKTEKANQSTLSTYAHTFDRPGIFDVRLLTTNGLCPDSSEARQVAVGHCWKYLTDHWRMGVNVGMDFSQGAVQKDTIAGLMEEFGNAAVSGKQGEILFYSNGRNVYNANDNLMLNGDSLTGFGFDPQPVQILPMPGDSNHYYVISANGSTNNPGLYYAVVDMRRDSGRGEVILKGQQLANGRYSAIETARHANGSDFWLMARLWSTNEIHTYHLDLNGFNTPIINTMSNSYGGNGQFRVSPDGERIALARISSILLADFDNSTGAINNVSSMGHSLPFNRGVAFSGNSRYLYATLVTNATTNDKIVQFDLDAGNAAAIQASETIVGRTLSQYGNMNLGPDGKIYIAPLFGGNFHLIHQPNQAGSGCEYQLYGHSMSPGFLQGPMCETPPGFGQRTELPLVGPAAVCAYRQDVDFRLADSDSTVWTYQGSGTVDSVGTEWLRIDFGAPGTDTLIVWSRLECAEDLRDTLLIQVNAGLPLSIGPDSLVCPGDSLILSVGAGFSSYLWQDSSQNNSLVINSAGLYWVAAMDTLGCTSRDSMTLSVVGQLPPPVALGSDTLLCPGANYTLDAGPGYASYLWQNAATSSNLTVSSPGTYFVQVTDSCGGTSSDTVVVSYQALPQVNLGVDTTLCPGDSLNLVAGTGFASYLWQNNAMSPTLTANTAGTYSVAVTDACGNTATDSLVLAYTPLPQVNLGADTTICNGSFLLLDAGTGFASYLWQNNAMSPTLTANQPGLYFVQVTDHCGNAARDSLQLAFAPLPQVDLGSDTVLCAGQSLNLQGPGGYAAYLWSDNSTGTALNISAPGTYWLEVTDSCGLVARDTISVTPCVGLEDGWADPAIALYPNPNTGHFQLALAGLAPGTKLDLRMYNALGQEVKHWTRLAAGAEVNWALEAPRLAAGQYVLLLRLNGKVHGLRMWLE